MKIKVDEQELLTINETQKKIICHEIPEEIFDEDMKRRIKWVLAEKYKDCFQKLQDEWIPKLKQRGVGSIPLEDDKFAELIFSQPDYKNRSQKDAERKQ